MRIAIVVGARPNFIKAAPVRAALIGKGIQVSLVHTGQHFDRAMSEAFFDVLGLPEPDHHLGVGGETRAAQFAGVVKGLSPILESEHIDRVFVVGDVTSTAAGAVGADMCDIPVDHVEAGLRSFDRAMPEERNRIVADSIADNLFVSEPSGVANLERENKRGESIHLVGNVMIDTLLKFREKAVAAAPWLRFGLEEKGYSILTVHRPANVDTPQSLGLVLEIIREALSRRPVVFPVHPRTRERIKEAGFELTAVRDLHVVEPMDYLSFLGMTAGACFAMTDSGGLQEETTVLGVPCLTMRKNTERPATLASNGGTSVLTGLDVGVIAEALERISRGDWPKGRAPDLWDGRAAERIADIVAWQAGHRT